MSVNLVISFNIKDEKLQSFKSIMSDVKTNLPAVRGCRSVKVLNHIENPLQFTVIECWDSKEIHGAYIEGLISSGTWSVIADHLRDDPVSGYYSEI